ncbi:hypothetical protein ES703_61549 [subsurface metagenome]
MIQAPGPITFTGVLNGTIDRNRHTVTCLRGAPGIPPSVCNYADAPPDIFGKEGAGVAAFAAFPLVEVP